MISATTLWTVVGIFGGLLAGMVLLAIVGKLTGATDFANALSNIFSAMWGVIRVPIDFFMHSMPAAFKIVMFVLLISVVGSFVYAMTFGITNVCVPKGYGVTPGVYSVDPVVGFSWVFNPPLQGEDIKNVTVQWEADSSIVSQDFLYQQKETHDFEEYLVTYGVVSPNVYKSTDFWTGGTGEDISLLTPRNQFKEMFVLNSDDFLELRVCQTKDGYVCTMDSYLVSEGCGSRGVDIGHIVYFYDSTGNILKMDINGAPGVANVGDFSKCSIPDAPTEVESQLMQFGPAHISFKMNNVRLLGPLMFWVDPYTDVTDVPIYNAQVGSPLRITRENTVFLDAETEGRMRMVNMPGEFTYVNSTDQDVVQIRCDETTGVNATAYGTHMTVAGIDPFNVSTMFVLVLIGIVVYIIFKR